MANEGPIVELTRREVLKSSGLLPSALKAAKEALRGWLTGKSASLHSTSSDTEVDLVDAQTTDAKTKQKTKEVNSGYLVTIKIKDTDLGLFDAIKRVTGADIDKFYNCALMLFREGKILAYIKDKRAMELLYAIDYLGSVLEQDIVIFGDRDSVGEQAVEYSQKYGNFAREAMIVSSYQYEEDGVQMNRALISGGAYKKPIIFTTEHDHPFPWTAEVDGKIFEYENLEQALKAAQ